MRLGVWTTVLALACFSLLGCAGDSNAGKVSGTVTLDGQPLKTGIIRFVPTDGRTATADGTITDGKYDVATPTGDKRVYITAPKVVGKQKAYENKPDSPVVDIVEELLPVRYNAQSELTYSVTAGGQSKNFELTSK